MIKSIFDFKIIFIMNKLKRYICIKKKIIYCLFYKKYDIKHVLYYRYNIIILYYYYMRQIVV